jgi:hypothetical protein
VVGPVPSRLRRTESSRKWNKSAKWETWVDNPEGVPGEIPTLSVRIEANRPRPDEANRLCPIEANPELPIEANLPRPIEANPERVSGWASAARRERVEANPDDRTKPIFDSTRIPACLTFSGPSGLNARRQKD